MRLERSCSIPPTTPMAPAWATWSVYHDDNDDTSRVVCPIYVVSYVTRRACRTATSSAGHTRPASTSCSLMARSTRSTSKSTSSCTANWAIGRTVCLPRFSSAVCRHQTKAAPSCPSTRRWKHHRVPSMIAAATPLKPTDHGGRINTATAPQSLP